MGHSRSAAAYDAFTLKSSSPIRRQLKSKPRKIGSGDSPRRAGRESRQLLKSPAIKVFAAGQSRTLTGFEGRGDSANPGTDRPNFPPIYFVRYFMTAIQLRGVTKTFGSVTAVDNLSLDIPAGSIHGFIGPNGSGKSTTCG